MKTKIKRHSRAVMSVFLAVSMLVSCLTVGLIATDAANVTDSDEALGWSSGDNFHYSLNSASWADVGLSSGSGELTIGSANSSLEFGFNVGGNWYAKHSSQSNPGYGSSTATYTAKKGSGISNYSMSGLPAGTYKIELVGTSGDDLTFRFYKKSNPVCTSIALTTSATNNEVSSDSDTFSLTATATGAVSGDVTYKFYKNDGTQVGTTQTSSTGTATVTGLTQAGVYQQKYYVVASKSDYDQVQSDKITIKNTSVSGTKTIYVGVVTYLIRDYSSSDPSGDILTKLNIHYWGGGLTADDAYGAVYTGIEKDYKVSDGWSDAQKFYMYRISIPAAATGMKAKIDTTYFGSSDGDATTQNTIYIYNYGGDKADYANESYTTSDLTIAAVDHATVTATYNGVTKGEGETFSDIFEGMSVSISVTPDKGYQCNGVTGTYSGGTATVTGSGNSYTLTMPGGDTTVETAIGDIAKKRLYFNNYYTRYAMPTAYAEYNDGSKPLGVGQTMTRIENTNTWYVDVPGDTDYITFIGDDGVNTDDAEHNTGTNTRGMMAIPWGTYTAPMYTAPYNHNDYPTLYNGGTWGEYVARTNEYTVSDGTTLNDPDHLFTGINATMYDYFVDGEVGARWITDIGSRQYSKNDGSQYDWNPFTKLNDALEGYADTFGVDVPLYFGNLNTKSGGDAVVQNPFNNNTIYTNWNLKANNSNGLSSFNNAVTGLSGLSLANSNIHYYKTGTGVKNENGAIMAMFDEDFLSGQNDRSEVLATILRSSAFPVRKSTISEKPTELYLNTSGFTNWENNSAIFKADFYNSSTTESTKRLVAATKVSDHLYKVTIPSGYTHIQWWRMDPSNPNGNPWNYGNEDTIPTNENCIFNVSGWDKSGSWGTSSSINLETHDYYEFDSTDGKDNAYITNIDRTNRTANIDYYAGSSNKKVHAAGMGSDGDWGFYPFDFERSGSSKSDSTLAHDLGFGMKLDINFTLEKNGEFHDGTHQVFNFSGDDDLWVFVDNKLVLDLGGAHTKTTGSIDFASKTVTATNTEAIGSAARNGSFDWFDNSNPNQPHTMTIYYMERGMYDSNLKFGFSFHAIPNQYKTEKKLKTSNINHGFYRDNGQTGDASNKWVEQSEAEERFVGLFEKTYQNESFTIQQSVNGASIAGKEYTVGSVTNTVGSDSNYQLKNDDIAYFIKQFDKGSTINVKEIFGSSNLYNYEPSVIVYDDGNNSQEFVTAASISSSDVGKVAGNNTNGYSFNFLPTSDKAASLDVLNIRALFTNQMKQHNLTITKAVDGDSNNEDFTLRIKFKFGDYDYISYPVDYTLNNGSATALSGDGIITIKEGDVLVIEKIPENAKIQIEEINIPSGYNCNGITVVDSDDATVTSTNITNGKQFTMGDKDITATVNNAQFSGFTVAKELKYSPSNGVFVDYPDATSEFRIKIEESSDGGSSYAALANKEFTSSDSSRTGTLQTDANGITTIKRGEMLSFNNISSGHYIRITEDTQESTYSGETVTDAHMPLDYQYKETTAVAGSSAPTGYDAYTDGGYYKGCKFQMGSDRVDVTITNMKPRYRWISNFNYESRSTNLGNSSLWGELSYQSKGVFTADELIKYTKFDIVTFTNDSTGRGIVFKSTELKSEFLTKKAPYVDNFRQTLGWNYDRASVDNIYDAEAGIELSLTPGSTDEAADALTVVYYFPNQMKWINSSTELVVDDSEGYMYEPGVPKANIAADGTPGDGDYSHSERKNKTVKYADWYTTNNVHVKDGADGAKFVTAPQKVWDVATESYKYFQYWSVRTITNDSTDSIEFARCYNREFNFVFYQDSYVYAVYGESQTNMYDIARYTENQANLTFLENSRNQWNQKSTAAEATYGTGNANYGDRLFSDFVIDLHYSKEYLITPAEGDNPAVYGQKNIQLNQISAADKSKYKAGVLIETVRDLNSSEVDTEKGKMLVTDKQISEKFTAKDNLNARNAAIDYLYGTLFNSESENKTKYLTSGIDVTSFDNKNQMEYAYSFANISQTASYRTETTRKMKLYRAYSYLIDNSDPTNAVKIISEPVYFTIYDMASITNDYDKEVTITG